MPKSLERCRDILFFCSETGVHHGDYSRLPQIGLIEKDNNGDSWLVTNREKTTIGFDVPLSSLVVKINRKVQIARTFTETFLSTAQRLFKGAGFTSKC